MSDKCSCFLEPCKLRYEKNTYFFFFVSFPQQLRALTQVLQLPIEVIQADASTIKIGEEFDSDPITLVYVVYMLLCLVGDFTGMIVQVYRAKLVEKCVCVYIYINLKHCI